MPRKSIDCNEVNIKVMMKKNVTEDVQKAKGHGDETSLLSERHCFITAKLEVP